MAPIDNGGYAARTLSDYLFIGFAVFGALVGFYHGFKIVLTLLRAFVIGGINIKKYAPKGSWALVTGASDGIGKEFAFQLAAKGYNIILISRTESKLSQIASELESKYTIKTKYLPIDFSKALTDTDCNTISTTIQDLDISILINNVGKSHDMPTPFVDTPSQELEEIININCFGTLRITQLVLPGMISRKRGLILTMGSFAGLTPTPLLATYSGSKAFLSHWSTALASEVRPRGIHVDLINSYLVTSAMSKIKRASATIPTPREFVKSTLGNVGVYVGGTTNVVTPYWAHGLMHWGMENVLGLGSRFLVDKNRGMHEDIRKRALRKKEREAKKL